MIYDACRASLWMHESAGNGKLNYSIINNEAQFNIDTNGADTENVGNIGRITKTSYYDVQNIDVRDCTFADFCKAIQFAKDSYSSFNYDDDLLQSFNNKIDSNEKSNYFEFFDNYRLDCAKRGDMDLYHKIVPIAQAAYNMLAIQDGTIKVDFKLDLTNDGFFKEDVFSDGCCLGTYDSYHLGEGCFDIGGRTYKLVAEYDIESTEEKPIVAISIYDFISGDDLGGKYIVDIRSVDLQHATPAEIFAYLSYTESLTDDSWESNYSYDTTFRQIYNSGVFDLDSISDLTEKSYSLTSVINEAKQKMSMLEVNEKQAVDFSFYKRTFTKKYIEKCISEYEKLLYSLDSEISD